MKKITSLSIGLAAAITISGAAMAALPAFSLQSLDKGEWTLRDKEHDMKPVRRLCLGNPRILAQLQHQGEACQVRQLKSDARMLVMRYSCKGSNGTTTIRRETDGLVQIRSQGLDHGAPFAFDYEARRTGSC